MRYNHIQKILSVALLLVFTAPGGITYPTYGGYNSYSNSNNVYSADASTTLSFETKLTNQNDKITLSLRDSDVKQVLRMFADKAGKNIVFHSTVDGKVTLDLVDMPINDAFGLVLQVTGLNYYIQGNTLIVMSKNSADNASFSKQDMMIFPVKYVGAAKIADFLNKNVFGMKKAGMSGIDAATVNAATNEVIVFGMASDADIVRKVIAQLDKEPLTRSFTVSHTTPAEMSDMICNMLLPAHGVGSTGGGNGGSNGALFSYPGSETGGAAGIVTGGASDTDSGSGSSFGSSGSSESNVAALKLGEGVVACTVQQSSSGASAGFDVQNLAISYYPQRGTIMLVGGSEAQADFIEKFIKDNDKKQPQAYLEMSIIELSEEGSKEFNNAWNIQSKSWNFSFNNGSTSGGRESVPMGLTRELLHLSQSVTEEVESNGSKYKQDKLVDRYTPRESVYSHGLYVSWAMKYLIDNRKARVLANPKILITNGQESLIDLTEDYVEKVTSEFLSSSGTGTTGAVQRTYTIGDDKGIKISLIPFISPDGYVTMNIKPQYATEAGSIYTDNEAGSRDLAATLLNRRNLDLKNVRIKDGETLAIGGLIQEGEQKTVQKVPVLGDLPLIGAAFRSSSTTKVKSELVIMLTPKIIQDDDVVADI